MSKKEKAYVGVTHIDTLNSLSTMRPLCGEYRRGDGFLYHDSGWKIHPSVTCPQCLEIGEFYSQGQSVVNSRKIVRDKRLPV
jgi:hypothetical protein